MTMTMTRDLFAGWSPSGGPIITDILLGVAVEHLSENSFMGKDFIRHVEFMAAQGIMKPEAYDVLDFPPDRVAQVNRDQFRLFRFLDPEKDKGLIEFYDEAVSVMREARSGIVIARRELDKPRGPLVKP